MAKDLLKGQGTSRIIGAYMDYGSDSPADEIAHIEAIEASMKDGRLSVRLPKKGEARPRTIEIR